MVETKIRILGIAPYEGMHTVMDRASQDYPNIQLDVFTGDLEVGVAIVQRMPPIPMTALFPGEEPPP